MGRISGGGLSSMMEVVQTRIVSRKKAAQKYTVRFLLFVESIESMNRCAQRR